MLMSMTTISGERARVCCMASSPSAASPTTVKPSRSSKERKPWRTKAGWSTGCMRASILDLRRENGNPNIKTSATAGGGVEVQSAADSGDSFFHAGQSQAGALAWFLDKGMVEADTVVLNFAREKVRVLIDVDRNGRGSRVLHNIIERLLKNPV